ncbi:MAG: NAD(P)/FAD-dependent oxidoreductase [Akkermansiaceae bacterium]
MAQQQSTQQKNDLTIIGAGFAGLSCACTAAAQGIKTVVLERKPCPGANIRTTGILVKEAADLLHLPEHLGRHIRGVRLYAPNGKFIDLCSPGYSFVATDTSGMMRWLRQRAEANGAEVLTDKNISRFERTAGGVTLPDAGMMTSYLIGCDGARSNVAKAFSLDRNRHFLMGAEAEYEGIRGLDSDKLHVFLDSKLAPGYIGWIVPGVGISQVGIAVRKPHRPKLTAFVKRISKVVDMSSSKVIGRRGGLIPCGGVLKRWHTDRVMLLGDAAGMVSPLTAGGIYPSIELGAKAGVTISRYLQGRQSDPLQGLLPMVPQYGAKSAMRWSMDNLTPPNFLYNKVLGNTVFQRIAQVLFFHHRGLFSKRAWKEILLMNRSLSHPLS